jgi:hypothetical protein
MKVLLCTAQGIYLENPALAFKPTDKAFIPTDKGDFLAVG